jgi:hypothetical protein
LEDEDDDDEDDVHFLKPPSPSPEAAELFPEAFPEVSEFIPKASKPASNYGLPFLTQLEGEDDNDEDDVDDDDEEEVYNTPYFLPRSFEPDPPVSEASESIHEASERASKPRIMQLEGEDDDDNDDVDDDDEEEVYNTAYLVKGDGQPTEDDAEDASDFDDQAEGEEDDDEIDEEEEEEEGGLSKWFSYIRDAAFFFLGFVWTLSCFPFSSPIGLHSCFMKKCASVKTSCPKH